MSRTMKILVVEDDPQLRAGTQRILERMGHDVHVTCDGQEALDASRANAFDLVVSDLDMPRMSGLDLYNSLPSELQARFILHSGNTAALEELGDTIRVVPKGVPPSELRAAVQRLLEEMESA